MRWCFTRFRHAARTARGGPKCVGASLGSGMPPARHGGPKCVGTSLVLGWRRPRVRGSARTRLVAFVLGPGPRHGCCARTRRVAARGRDTVWVARGVVAFFRVVYPKVYPKLVSVNRRNAPSGEVAQNALVLH